MSNPTINMDATQIPGVSKKANQGKKKRTPKLSEEEKIAIHNDFGSYRLDQNISVPELKVIIKIIDQKISELYRKGTPDCIHEQYEKPKLEDFRTKASMQRWLYKNRTHVKPYLTNVNFRRIQAVENPWNE